MGKRELVLIALFLVAGVVVYQVTAPPAPAGSDLSVGGIFQRMKRGMQGARETATGESHQTIPVEPAAQVLRISLPRACDLTITGSDRTDIAVEVKSTAHGYTPEEAKTAANAATLKVEPSGDGLTVSGVWPVSRGGSGDAYVTQVTITLAVPRRLAVSVQPHIGLLSVTDVAKVESVSSRGETHVLRTTGDVKITHIGGALEVIGGTSLTLSARNSKGEVSKISGTTRLEVTGGRLDLSELTGTLDVEARNADLTFEKVGGLKPAFRVNAVGGSLRMNGLRTEGRIDGRNTDIDVKLDGAAPVTIYNQGAIVVTAPPNGFTLDASATEGRVTVDGLGITPSEGPDSRASGKVLGGGPTLTLRATRGRIDVRKKSLQ